jgi:kynurenine formamidase
MRKCLLLLAILVHSNVGKVQGANPTTPLTLNELIDGKARTLDLTYPLNRQNAFWPGDKYYPFELTTIATLERDGVLSKAFSSPEHLGTHIDAPNHFGKGQISVDQIKTADLFAPGVMIDVAAQAHMNPDLLLTPEHLHAWEAKYGRIPDGAVVLLNTGWGRHWGDPVRYQNHDAQGKMHFPGYSTDAAKFLIADRHVRGIGIDTMSIDYGLSRDFRVHKLINGAGRYGLENVAQIDKLPPRDFYLLVAPMKIDTGTGGPTRIFAIMR